MSSQSSGCTHDVENDLRIDSDINVNVYKKLAQVGDGSYGLVYKVEHKTTKDIYALKEIKYNKMNFMDRLKDTKREIYALKEIDHKNLVKYHGASIENKKFNILTEFMDKGSLRDHIEDNGVFLENDAAKCIKEVVEGIKYLHKRNIIHRDIKCGNILWNSNDQIKLTDFGLAKHVDNIDEFNEMTNCGTYRFMAPELLNDKKYNSSVDIWAIGVTVVEMLTGYPIYPELSHQKFIEKVTNPNEPITTKLDAISTRLSYFLDIVFTKNPNNRPKPDDLLLTKFVLNIN